LFTGICSGKKRASSTPKQENNLMTSESTVEQTVHSPSTTKHNKEDTTMVERSQSLQAFLDKFARSLEKGDGSKVRDGVFLHDQIPLLCFIPNREMERKDFTVGNILGSGNFGTVNKGEATGLFYPGSKTPVAMKTIRDVTNHNDTDCFVVEMKILSNLEYHCNLVNMVGTYTTKIRETGEVWMLLEYCELGDLKNFICNNKYLFENSFEGYIDTNNCIENRLLLHWSYDIAKGMEYLASKHVMHGDLAARNILLTQSGNSDKKMVAKVADFGLSKKMTYRNSYEKKERNYVPWKWMAFEFLESNIFKMKSDVWSYAVVIWEIFSLGELPYGEKEFDEVFEDLQAGYQLECPDGINKIINWPASQFYNTIAKKCFVLEEKDRISFKELVTFIQTMLNEAELNSYEKVSNQRLFKHNLILDEESRLRIRTTSNATKKIKVGVGQPCIELADRRPSCL
jgi:serine/threonine protein kinase